MKNENPFYDNHVFRKEDINRAKITWRDKMYLWMYPTYVQLNEGYAYYWKHAKGKFYLIKVEQLA